MSGIKKYMVEDAYLNDMEKAYELVDEDDYEYYDDSFDDYDDEFDYPEVENKIEQFYGVDGNGTPKYVALSKEQVQKFAKAHPEEDIVRVESSSGMRFNLYEALKAFDKRQFRENASSCELEMLYESVRDTLSAQQKNDLAKFVRKARTAEEINTYMTGMLAKAANESLEESSHVEYGDAMSKANQSKDVIDSAKDKDGKEVCAGSSVIVPQQLGYSDREAKVEDIFINKHGVEMLRVRYNDSKTENVAAKSCTLNESLNIEDYNDGYVTLRDGEPNFVYNNLSDAKRGMMYDRAGDTDAGEFDHTYELRKLENGQLTALNEDVDDVDEAAFNKLKEIAYELDAYIEDKVWVRDFWYDGQFDNTISFEIYGDWKHDHARFKYYASEWLDNKGLKYKMWENITDDDGSDSYGATHTIRLYDFVDKAPLEEGIKQDKEKIIKSFIEQCLEKFNTFGDETDAELEVPDKLDNNAFYDDLEWEAEKNGIRLSVQETSEFPGGVYLYYYIRRDNLDEGYVSQKETKFSNGQLKDLSPDDLMQKVMNTGQSLHSVRKCGDDYYTIFVQYKDFFGPTGADNPDTDYVLDIIKEDSSGNQDRVVLDSGKASDIIEKLRKFRDETCLVDDMKKNAAMPY